MRKFWYPINVKSLLSSTRGRSSGINCFTWNHHHHDIMYNICSKSCHFTMDQAGVHIDAHDDDDHLLPLVVEAIVAHAIFWGAWTPRASSWWSSWPRSWASSPWWCSPSPCRAAGGVGRFTLWGSSWRKQESRSTSAYNHNYLLNADWWRMTMGRWNCW